MTDLLWRFLEVSAIAIGVPLFLRLLAKLFPYKPPDRSEHNLSFPELKNKYAKWEIASLIPLFFFAFLSGYAIYRALIWLSHHSTPQAEVNRYLMLPDQDFFMLPALFISLVFRG